MTAPVAPLQLIKQRHRTDCGIACVAMLARVSYEEAEAAFQFGPRTKSRITNITAIYRALRKLGLSVKLPMVGGAPNGIDALLKCNRSPVRRAGVKRWHWAVYSAADGAVLDPLADGKVRPILSHMPVARLTVTP